jgi:ATP-dependent protease HslVU (ClpYQ) ATPase subunit
MGVNYPNQEVLAKKYHHLKNGDMDERFVTIEIPEEMELQSQTFINLDEFILFLKKIKLTQLKGKSTEKHVISVKEAKQFLLERY